MSTINSLDYIKVTTKSLDPHCDCNKFVMTTTKSLDHTMTTINSPDHTRTTVNLCGLQ